MKNLRFSLTLPMLVLAVLALLTFWIDRYVQVPDKISSKQKTHHPDYFMENFVSSKTDNGGKLKTMLAAIKLEHYPDDDSLHLVRPRMTQFTDNGGFSQIEAQRGVISGNGDLAEFYDHVVVHRPATGDGSDMQLHTDYLKILPEKQLATTNQEVLINQGPSSYMRGVGMVYDSANHEITLKNKVRIHYVKSKSAPIAKKSAVTKSQEKPQRKPITKH
jgi:lipopolysaccharide export system protein LptC